MSSPTDFLPPEQRKHVEEQLSAMQFIIPTEPGHYTDCAGDPWELTEDGHWFDKQGETKDLSWNYVLALFGPFTRVENGDSNE